LPSNWTCIRYVTTFRDPSDNTNDVNICGNIYKDSLDNSRSANIIFGCGGYINSNISYMTGFTIINNTNPNTINLRYFYENGSQISNQNLFSRYYALTSQIVI